MAALQAADPIQSYVSPWLSPVYYPLGTWVLRTYFDSIRVQGLENLPLSGPVLIAPTHRSRWDALVIPYIAGRQVTGRDLRFMVSHDEMLGLQGWVIRQFGGFPVDTRQPSIAALRHGVELLVAGEPLVIFPEGNIFRDRSIQPLKPGLARLAIQASQARGQADLKIIPVYLQYTPAHPTWGAEVEVYIGRPLNIADYDCRRSKATAVQLTRDLEMALNSLVPQGLADLPTDPQLVQI